jgi:hypothetical protein
MPACIASRATGARRGRGFANFSSGQTPPAPRERGTDGGILPHREPGPRHFGGVVLRCEARRRFGVGRASRSVGAPSGSSPTSGVERSSRVVVGPSQGGSAADRYGGQDTGGPVVRKDLEGERSPGRAGRLPAGNGGVDVTDSMMEQGLEADAPVRRSAEGRLWQRRRSEVPSGTGGNGKGATATVTWCGCRRGESFEGCEDRRGERCWTPGNATNPRTGSGMQQARDLRAEETVEVVRNHEGGTGFRGWLPRDRSTGREARVGVDARWHVGGGEGWRPDPSGSPFTNPTRGGR